MTDSQPQPEQLQIDPGTSFNPQRSRWPQLKGATGKRQKLPLRSGIRPPEDADVSRGRLPWSTEDAGSVVKAMEGTGLKVIYRCSFKAQMALTVF